MWENNQGLLLHWSPKLPSKRVEFVNLASKTFSVASSAILEIFCPVFSITAWDSISYAAIQIARHERGPASKINTAKLKFAREL